MPRLARVVSCLISWNPPRQINYHEGFYGCEGFVALSHEKVFMIMGGPCGGGAIAAGGAHGARYVMSRRPGVSPRGV
jgi:hypothetical protein